MVLGVQCADQPTAHHSCEDHHSLANGGVLHGPGQWRALQHRQRGEPTINCLNITLQ